MRQACFLARALSFFVSLDFFLATVRLCIVLVAAVLSSFLTVSRSCSFAVSTLPEATASSKRIIWVLTWLFLARLVILFFASWRTRFFADNECATFLNSCKQSLYIKLL